MGDYRLQATPNKHQTERTNLPLGMPHGKGLSYRGDGRAAPPETGWPLWSQSLQSKVKSKRITTRNFQPITRLKQADNKDPQRGRRADQRSFSQSPHASAHP